MTTRYVTSASCTADKLIISQGQRVAVIGNGSSGIQIVPAMLPNVSHIDHYMRSATWLSPSFAREHIEKRGKGLENCESITPALIPFADVECLVAFTSEDIKTFKQDHQSYQKFRKGRRRSEEKL